MGVADGVSTVEVDRLVSPRWIAVLGLMVLSGMVLRQPVIFFAGAVLLLALVLSWFWGRRCLDKVEYLRSFSSPAVAFGEEVILTTRVVNRKLLPLSWLEVDDETPSSLRVRGVELISSYKAQRASLQQILTLRWYERVTRHYRIQSFERGDQRFGPVALRSGDLFGLARRSLTLEAREAFLVYPKVVPMAAFGLPTRFPIGDARTPDRLLRDPLRVSGIRPYAQGDSVRQLHWKATARLGALQVKTEDPSATLRAVLLLNASTSEHLWQGVDGDLLELLICLTASLASNLVAQRAQVGLAVNVSPPLMRGYTRVPASRSQRQLPAILTALARIHPLADSSYVAMLAAEKRHLPAGATVTLLTGLLNPTLVAQARAFRSAGHPVTLLLAGEGLRAATVPGLECYWIGDEMHWRDLSELRPQPTGLL